MNRVNFVSNTVRNPLKPQTLENTSTLFNSRQEVITMLQQESIEKEFFRELAIAKEKVVKTVENFFSAVAKEKIKELSEEKGNLFSIIGNFSYCCNISLFLVM